MAKLNKYNSPQYTIGDVRKQNQAFRLRLRKLAKSMDIETLKKFLKVCEDSLNSTQNIAVAMTERCRVKILTNVLNDKIKSI